MKYVLREMSDADKHTVFENCDEREQSLIRAYKVMNLEGKIYTWAVDAENDSYLFRTFRHGDSRSMDVDFYFYFMNENYLIRTNGAWPLRVKYDKKSLKKEDINSFEKCLINAIRVHGLRGILGKTINTFEIVMDGEE